MVGTVGERLEALAHGEAPEAARFDAEEGLRGGWAVLPSAFNPPTRAHLSLLDLAESVDGVESYSYHRGEDGTYWFFALMSSMEAAQQHANNEAMQAAMPALMSLLAGPPDMAMTTPVAANGFDF